MPNEFQKWLMAQGYVREHETWGAWLKDGEVESDEINPNPVY